MAEEDASSGKVGITAKATAAVFATVLAPVLVALGLKWVDKVDLPLTGGSSAGSGSTTTAGSSGEKPAADPAAPSTPGGTTAPDLAEVVTLQEVPLKDGWVFYPVDPGAIDIKRFLFRPDGSFVASANGPRGILLRPGDYEDFRLSVGWRLSGAPTTKRTLPSSVLIRSGLEHWPENRVEAAFATGKIGRLRWGKNVSLTLAAPVENKVIAERQWHTLEIDCRGNEIEVRNDGEIVCGATNVSRKTGRVGLTVMGRDMEYRDFLIERRPSARPAPSRPGTTTGQPSKKTTSDLLGTWRIQGRGHSKTQWTGVLTLKHGEQGGLAGHIDWTGKGGRQRGVQGREIVTATFDPATRLLTLHGERIEEGERLTPSHYRAVLSEDGQSLTISGDDFPGEWQGERLDEASEE